MQSIVGQFAITCYNREMCTTFEVIKDENMHSYRGTAI